MTPVSPFGPGGGMFASDPRNTHLFTQRPDNAVNTPTYQRPGTGELKGDQARALVAWLNSVGFRFAGPRYKDPNRTEGNIIALEPGDTASRVYYAKHDDPTPLEADDSGQVNLALVADALGGVLSSPTTALHQLGHENGIAPIVFRGVRDADIVAALKRIFFG